MQSAPASSGRTQLHTRSVVLEAFARDDGNLDLEVEMSDVKPHDLQLQSGLRVAGEPVHRMRLRVTIDHKTFCVCAAEAVMNSVPYPGYCEPAAPAYQALIGLNLMKGFGRELRERLAGINGCTHLTELAQQLPTLAIQAMAGSALARRAQEAGERGLRKPFQLDSCQAMRTDGEVVRRYYPKWYVGTASEPQTASEGG